MLKIGYALASVLVSIVENSVRGEEVHIYRINWVLCFQDVSNLPRPAIPVPERRIQSIIACREIDGVGMCVCFNRGWNTMLKKLQKYLFGVFGAIFVELQRRTTHSIIKGSTIHSGINHVRLEARRIIVRSNEIKGGTAK